MLGIVPALIASGDCGICFRLVEVEDGVVCCGSVQDWVLWLLHRLHTLMYRLFAVAVVEYVEDDLVRCRRSLSQFQLAHWVVIVEVVVAWKWCAMVVKWMMVMVLLVMVPWE